MLQLRLVHYVVVPFVKLQHYHCRLSTILLELPVSIVQRAHLSCLQPSRDTVEVEGVIANAPGNGALFGSGCTLICLTFDA